MLKKYLRYAIIFSLLILIGTLYASATAFAAISIKYGWTALDANKNLVLEGSQHQLTSGKACPIQFIFNGKDMKTVPAGAVIYLNNTKTGKAQALILGDKIPGYKDAFITTFTIVNKPATTANNANTSRTSKSTTNSTPTAKKKVNISSATISGIKDLRTTSLSTVKQNITVKANKANLKLNTDYSVSYQIYKDKKWKNISSAPKDPGTYRIVITGKGSYNGSKSVKFKVKNLGDGLAIMACKLSYSQPKYRKNNCYGTAQYKTARQKVGINATLACDRGAAVAIRYSGYDTKFPYHLEHSNGVHRYLGFNKKDWGSYDKTAKAKTDRWKLVGKYSTVSKKGNLRPGDVVIRGGHICIYVGKSIPQSAYKSYLKGKSGDKGKPTSDSQWVSAHYAGGGGNASALCIGNTSFAAPNYGGGAYVYRCVKPMKNAKL